MLGWNLIHVNKGGPGNIKNNKTKHNKIACIFDEMYCKLNKNPSYN